MIGEERGCATPLKEGIFCKGEKISELKSIPFELIQQAGRELAFTETLARITGVLTQDTILEKRDFAFSAR